MSYSDTYILGAKWFNILLKERFNITIDQYDSRDTQNTSDQHMFDIWYHVYTNT